MHYFEIGDICYMPSVNYDEILTRTIEDIEDIGDNVVYTTDVNGFFTNLAVGKTVFQTFEEAERINRRVKEIEDTYRRRSTSSDTL